MSQTIRGRVCKYDFIAPGQITGTENAVAVAVPGPTPLIENTILGLNPVSAPTGAAATPYGIEKYGSVAALSPNPERVQSGA